MAKQAKNSKKFDKPGKAKKGEAGDDKNERVVADSRRRQKEQIRKL